MLSSGEFQLNEFGGNLNRRLQSLQVPEYLDGGSINAIPADSVYSCIAKRTALCALPGLHSRDDAAHFSSRDVQEAYMKIYHGDCYYYDLVRLGGSWEKADKYTARLFIGTISMCISTQINEANEKAVWEVDASIEVTLGVLVCMAGIGPDEDYIQAYKDVTDQLKPMYHKPKKAREALMSAVASPGNIQSFCSNILMCCTNREKSKTRKHNPNTTKNRHADKESARKKCSPGLPQV